MIVHHVEESRRAARAVVSATPALETVAKAATAEEALELAYASAEPGADALARSEAAAAMHVDDLTPASLQAFGEGFQSE